MSDVVSPTQSQSVSLSAKVFRIAAFAEAVSWLGLLIGMFFKWVVQSTQVGVQVFGPIHGFVFICYVLTSLWTAKDHRWSAKELLLALVSSIPPFMTIWFERRAERMGLLVR
ncbi:DUF3817 domain-containing protein [Calidifontibacter terrae]